MTKLQMQPEESYAKFSALIAQFLSVVSRRRGDFVKLNCAFAFLTPCRYVIFNKVTFCYSIQIANVGEMFYHHHSAPWDKSSTDLLVIARAEAAELAAQFLPHNSCKFSVIISF